jgi:radical SAM superfamily enzyme YgiQ (UPF0313 family)
MYDVILISPHYNYDRDGGPIPVQDAADYQDLSMTIPLGIIHVAQYLHECGFKVRVVHLPHEIYALRRMGLPLAQLQNPVEAILSKYPARVCGIQAHFYLYCGGALRISEIYKNLFPDSTILVGGYMATACWKEFLTVAPGIDGVVLGEGEQTFRTIVEKAQGSDHRFLNTIDGVASRRMNGDLLYNPPRAEAMMGLGEMPIITPEAPPFDNLIWPRRSFLNISRGLCPETCAYCVANNPDINARLFRTMTIARIIEQLRVYQAHGIKSVFFGENHFLNMAFMTELIEKILQEDLALTFELESHPALFRDNRLLKNMIAAGFHRFTLGCESGSNVLLKRIGRHSNTGQFMESVKGIADAGGLAVTSWICNLPGETKEEFQETHDLLRQVVNAGGFIYWIENLHVLPGSRLYMNPKKWQIETLLKNMADWVRWSPVSKKFVDPEDAIQAPLRYLTHVNANCTPQEMMRRFYALRRLARDLVPEMKSNLVDRSMHLPAELVQTEMQKLDWYQDKGWKLILF